MVKIKVRRKIKKPPEQRVAVFIDTNNLYHSAKNLYNARVNFKELLKTAIAGRKFIRALAYVVRTKTGEEKPFLEALKSLGIEIREKENCYCYQRISWCWKDYSTKPTS